MSNNITSEPTAQLTTKGEEKQVAKFLLSNPKFLENYLVKHSSTQFLHDVTSRLEEISNFRENDGNKQHSSESLSDKMGNKSYDGSKIGKRNIQQFGGISISVSQDDSSEAETGTPTEIFGPESDLLKPGNVSEHQNEESLAEGGASPPYQSVVSRTARKSVTSELFQQWLQSGSAKIESPSRKKLSSQCSLSAGGTPFRPSSPVSFASSNLVGSDLELLEQNDRLMDLILDISNELDINTLCHKILLNVGHLTKADRCSLFLARGPRDKRYLEAKLFDLDINTSKTLFPNNSLTISSNSQHLMHIYPF